MLNMSLLILVLTTKTGAINDKTEICRCSLSSLEKRYPEGEEDFSIFWYTPKDEKN